MRRLRGGFPHAGNRRPGTDASQARPPHVGHVDKARPGAQNLRENRSDAKRGRSERDREPAQRQLTL